MRSFEWLCQGLNWGPSACQADVLALSHSAWPAAVVGVASSLCWRCFLMWYFRCGWSHSVAIVHLFWFLRAVQNLDLFAFLKNGMSPRLFSVFLWKSPHASLFFSLYTSQSLPPVSLSCTDLWLPEKNRFSTCAWRVLDGKPQRGRGRGQQLVWLDCFMYFWSF